MIWSKLVPTLHYNSIAKIWKKEVKKDICPERESNPGPPASWTPVAIYKHWYCEQHSQSASSNGRSAGTLEQSKVRWHLWFPGTWDWVEDSLWLGHFHATEVANATHTCLRQRSRRRRPRLKHSNDVHPPKRGMDIRRNITVDLLYKYLCSYAFSEDRSNCSLFERQSEKRMLCWHYFYYNIKRFFWGPLLLSSSSQNFGLCLCS